RSTSSAPSGPAAFASDNASQASPQDRCSYAVRPRDVASCTRGVYTSWVERPISRETRNWVIFPKLRPPAFSKLLASATRAAPHDGGENQGGSHEQEQRVDVGNRRSDRGR